MLALKNVCINNCHILFFFSEFLSLYQNLHHSSKEPQVCMLKSKGPVTEPLGTSERISTEYWNMNKLCFLVPVIQADREKCCCLLIKLMCIQFRWQKSWDIQSNALDKLVGIATQTLFSSRIFLILSNIGTRQCCTLRSFRKPHWYLENI